jgi:hypothetical protein
VEAFKGQDAVISTTPAHNVETETAFVNAAVKAGVKCFIPSKFGSNSQNAKCVKVFPMIASKVKVVDYLKSKEEAGLTWTVIATGTFLTCMYWARTKALHYHSTHYLQLSFSWVLWPCHKAQGHHLGFGG